MGYTKGPWAKGMFPDSAGYKVMAGNRVIAVIKNQQSAPACEPQSNARLIAAAPDLLEALEMSPHMLHKFQDGSDCHCSQCEFVRLRDAAINRAKGEN